MKTIVKFLTVFFLAGVFSANLAFSQEGKREYKRYQDCVYNDLSESQKSSIDAIKLESEKKTIVYKADLKIKKAELDKLLLAENPSKKNIDAKIDEITKLKGDIKKERIDHRLKVRDVLTPEQRVDFDLKHKGKNFYKNSHYGNKKSQSYGKGQHQNHKN